MKDKKLQKEKTNTAEFRKPYYALSDGVNMFAGVVKDKKDRVLSAKANQLKKLVSDIHKHLDKNYIWD